MGRWLDECITQDGETQTSVRELFANWRQWANENGEHPGSLKRLSMKLVAKGFVKGRFGSGGDRTVCFGGLVVPNPLGVVG